MFQSLKTTAELHLLGPVYMEVWDPKKVKSPEAGHHTYHVLKCDQILKMSYEWTGGFSHLSGLPHLPGVPHLHLNRPLKFH